MNRLEKELDKLSRKELGSTTKEVKEATLLLSTPKENLEILTRIGLDHQIMKSNKKVEIINKLDVLERTFDTKTYTGAQLKKLCVKHDLKLLTSDKYKGKIDNELSSIITNFDKNYKEVTISSNNFFILAPREAFEDKHGNYNDKSEYKYMFFYRESRDKHSEEDYNAASTKDVFNLLHSSGKDYSILRQSRFLFYDSGNDNMSSGFVTGAALLLYMIALICIVHFSAVVILCIIASILLIINSLSEKNYDYKWNKRG